MSVIVARRGVFLPQKSACFCHTNLAGTGENYQRAFPHTPSTNPARLSSDLGNRVLAESRPRVQWVAHPHYRRRIPHSTPLHARLIPSRPALALPLALSLGPRTCPPWPMAHGPWPMAHGSSPKTPFCAFPRVLGLLMSRAIPKYAGVNCRLQFATPLCEWHPKLAVARPICHARNPRKAGRSR
jgi:hypothetical protein